MKVFSFSFLQGLIFINTKPWCLLFHFLPRFYSVQTSTIISYFPTNQYNYQLFPNQPVQLSAIFQPTSTIISYFPTNQYNCQLFPNQPVQLSAISQPTSTIISYFPTNQYNYQLFPNQPVQLSAISQPTSTIISYFPTNQYNYQLFPNQLSLCRHTNIGNVVFAYLSMGLTKIAQKIYSCLKKEKENINSIFLDNSVFTTLHSNAYISETIRDTEKISQKL